MLVDFWMKLGTFWLIFSSKRKDMRPTYRQSQRLTYLYATVLSGMEDIASLWMEGFSRLRKGLVVLLL